MEPKSYFLTAKPIHTGSTDPLSRLSSFSLSLLLFMFVSESLNLPLALIRLLSLSFFPLNLSRCFCTARPKITCQYLCVFGFVRCGCNSLISSVMLCMYIHSVQGCPSHFLWFEFQHGEHHGKTTKY